jgi:hypothetical protein
MTETDWLTVLQAHFEYDPETGRFARDGKPSGSNIGGGYVRLRFGGEGIAAHRAAFLVTHGSIPDGMDIDHVNGDPSDNRIANLRPLSRSENNQNRLVAAKSNKLGVLGVYRKRNGYRAEIMVNGKSRCLGTFTTVKDAEAAYRAAKLKYHPAFRKNA